VHDRLLPERRRGLLGRRGPGRLSCRAPFLLGVRVEEFHPLSPGQIVPLFGGGSGSLWSERLTATDATSSIGTQRGSRRQPGDHQALSRKGCAWYISTRLCDERNELLVRDALAAAGVRPVVAKLGPAVHSLLRRDGAGGSWQFWLNYGPHRSGSQPAAMTCCAVASSLPALS